MKKGLRLAGLGSLHFTLGCLRPGGTTMYFTEGWSKLALQQQGRWASDISLSVYLQGPMASVCGRKCRVICGSTLTG
eukprot:8990024-Karenia_brevis.AAC.1